MFFINLKFRKEIRRNEYKHYLCTLNRKQHRFEFYPLPEEESNDLAMDETIDGTKLLHMEYFRKIKFPAKDIAEIR